MGIAWHAPIPEEVNWKLIRWTMAEIFGWSLEYIDSLSLGEIEDYLSIQDGKERSRKSVNAKLISSSKDGI